ncbi:MAG: hypothetical protein A3D16_18550 [Rhodobacterales bacterium RIFCSPHIGHO2_02_FULL_62_130]|nr:MAG: hypothetical protein A3D16_18550 [Rhodobacterales bacterium RIFCSPHIGHO2_02_FULL_62_130]OHC60309.1 MAG: hypothetical protein A3E48_18575 [Rhodobacterales bacterium RIFCSPHIGHO2_12_FULL_62_75]HCZ01547.1 hypothetical protein [Rhodobacter sp.]
MIVVRLEGGLGNQLFQYSYGLELQAKYGGRLLFDRHAVRNDSRKENVIENLVDLEPRSTFDSLCIFLLAAYAGLQIRMFSALFGKTRETSACLAKVGVHHCFDSRYTALRVPQLPFLFLHGNFMSGKYFESASDLVRASIHAERVLGDKHQETVSRIRCSNSVAVHVRRGDYLEERWRSKLHVCTEIYYETAVQIALNELESPKFFVFSNSEEDTNWVRENYRFMPEGTEFVSPALNDFEHFALMSECRHFIIANSTFSWWSSYLSRNQDKLIIAPKPWNRAGWDMTDLYSEDWVVIDVDHDKVMVGA